jgi:hypothetical protein
VKFDDAAAHSFKKLRVRKQLFFRSLDIDLEQVDVGKLVSADFIYCVCIYCDRVLIFTCAD